MLKPSVCFLIRALLNSDQPHLNHSVAACGQWNPQWTILLCSKGKILMQCLVLDSSQDHTLHLPVRYL